MSFFSKISYTANYHQFEKKLKNFEKNETIEAQNKKTELESKYSEITTKISEMKKNNDYADDWFNKFSPLTREQFLDDRGLSQSQSAARQLKAIEYYESFKNLKNKHESQIRSLQTKKDEWVKLQACNIVTNRRNYLTIAPELEGSHCDYAFATNCVRSDKFTYDEAKEIKNKLTVKGNKSIVFYLDCEKRANDTYDFDKNIEDNQYKISAVHRAILSIIFLAAFIVAGVLTNFWQWYAIGVTGSVAIWYCEPDYLLNSRIWTKILLIVSLSGTIAIGFSLDFKTTYFVLLAIAVVIRLLLWGISMLTRYLYKMNMTNELNATAKKVTEVHLKYRYNISKQGLTELTKAINEAKNKNAGYTQKLNQSFRYITDIVPQNMMETLKSYMRTGLSFGVALQYAKAQADRDKQAAAIEKMKQENERHNSEMEEQARKKQQEYERHNREMEKKTQEQIDAVKRQTESIDEQNSQLDSIRDILKS